MNQLLPFIPDQMYNRRKDIHSRFGGNWQSGISPSASHPFIFIFSGHSGKQHGYEDAWDNPNVYSYTGEGQAGDMQFTKGNLALRDHLVNGKRVFLFENLGRGSVRFVAEVVVIDADYFEALDTSGNMRIAIKFFFKRQGATVRIETQPQANASRANEPMPKYGFTPPNETERRGLVISRIGQGAYRKRILHRWEYECAVTGFQKQEILIASHIVPWASASDKERLDVHNGILLSPTYDALFDRHLISFEDSGKIILSARIKHQAFLQVGVNGNEVINKFNDYNFQYLERHREVFLKAS